MSGILELLSAGGDLATVAIFFLLWRLDRRITVIETKHDMHLDAHH